MKRYISKPDASIQCSRFSNHVILKNHHFLDPGCSYSIYIDNEDDLSKLSLQVSELHPYDDAIYAFARVEQNNPTLAQIIKNGKFLSSVKMPEYDDESWEDPQEYIDEFIDRIIYELHEVNKDVKPKIMHF